MRLPPAREDRGAIAILAAVSLTLLCMSGALAVDLGNLAQLHRRAQSGVENAAISGANLLAEGSDSLNQIVTSVEDYVEENWSDATPPQISAGAWATCPAVPSGFAAPVGSNENCVTFNGATAATSSAISVVMPPQAVSLGLARAGGIMSGTVYGAATARVATGTFPCALCVLGPTGLTLSDGASGSFNVTDTSGNAGITVNSSGTPAAEITGSGSINAPQIDVAGSTGDSGSGHFSPTPTTGVLPMADPLSNIVPPTPATTAIPLAPYLNIGSSNGGTLAAGAYGSVSLTGSGSVTIPPGNYRSINVSGSGSVTLESGTYFLTGGFTVGASGSVHEAGGVLLYFTCSAFVDTVVAACNSGGETGGYLSLTGSGSVTLSPVTTGTYADLTVFYDRNDDDTLVLTASGGLSVSGTIYADSSTLDLSGSGATLSSLVVVSSAAITGSGSVGVSYNAAQNVSPASAAYLCSTSAGNC